MHWGIPTTRSLAVVCDGEAVYREKDSAGAVPYVWPKVNPRGHFLNIFAVSHRLKRWKFYWLRDKRHYPELLQTETRLCRFSESDWKQTDLIVNWMRVGFIHGVRYRQYGCFRRNNRLWPCAFMKCTNPKRFQVRLIPWPICFWQSALNGVVESGPDWPKVCCRW